MSGHDADLEEYLDVVGQLADEHLATGDRVVAPGRLPQLTRVLDQAGVLDLGRETAGMGGELRWLTATVTTLARRSPAIAYALASRYAAQRALVEADETANVTTARAAESPTGLALATFPTVLAPEAVVVVGRPGTTVVVVATASLRDTGIERSGLEGARLCTAEYDTSGTLLSDRVSAAVTRDLELLVTAVLLGTAEAALTASEHYAGERQQFGAAISSFAGLRAILAEMAQQVAGIRALLNVAVEEEESQVRVYEASAAAGRAAVQVAVDAIQVHGGYGYIEEYPVAGLLRDVMSLRAAAQPRRTVLAGIAADRLGSIG